MDASTTGFRMTRGRDLVQSYTLPVLERAPAYAVWFCSRCGSPVPNPDPDGDVIEIPAGALDGATHLSPDKHIYVDLKADWEHIDDEVPAFTRDEIRAFRAAHGRVRAARDREPDRQ